MGTSPDAFFEQQWDPLKNADIVAGVYLLLRFRTERFREAPTPAAQAQAWLKILDGRLEAKKDFPPALDVEFPGKGAVETDLSAGQLLDGVREAWKLLADHFGAAPIIYTSGRVWRDDLDGLPAPDLTESPLWLARYEFKEGLPAVRDPGTVAKMAPPVPPPWADSENWFIHQYQGDATSLPGFPIGRVDMNRFHAVMKGDSGGNVSWAQRRLGMAEPTGVFDDDTEAKLRAFQSANGLSVDGVLGPRTFARLAWA